jgi:hypothetical protein
MLALVLCSRLAESDITFWYGDSCVLDYVGGIIMLLM